MGGPDSAGDEGAIFAESLIHGTLSENQLLSLRSENDAGVINLNGRIVQVEQYSYSGPGSSPGTGGSPTSSSSSSGYSGSGANLDEGIDAYRHFLNGDSETYTVDYDKYMNKDEHGRTTRDSIIEDVQSAGDQLFANEVANGDIDLDALEPGDSVTFIVAGDPIAVNENVQSNPDARFPYPESENWQKAIGAHHIYSTSEVSVTRQKDGSLLASADITVDFEDRYNFNPGQADIATDVLDSERGVLEESGLAHQFDQVGQADLKTQWIIGNPESTYELPSNGWLR